MALNVTFAGYAYRDGGSLSNSDINYQAFFYKVNGGSSTSKWNDVRTVESSGYYSFNLGDGDFLTQDGAASSSDRVVVVFWKGTPLGTNRNDVCTIMDEWGAFEAVLDGSDVYTKQAQVKVNIIPNIIWSFPDTGYVDTNYSSSHTSNDAHSWSFMGNTMHHWYTRYGETINWVNQVDESNYYWDDGDSDLNLSGVVVGTHQWGSSGLYDVDLVIEDKCGGTASGTEQIQIYWHSPTADITMTPSTPDPNEPISFQWTGTDVDNRITTIDWVVYDFGIYGSTNTTTSGQLRDNVVPHTDGTGTAWCGQTSVSGAFTNPGTHNVAIVIHWNDGFSDQVINYDENFTQGLFSGPNLSFTQDPPQATISGTVEFNNTSTDVSRVGLGLPDCTEYDWTWTDDGVGTSYLDKPYSYKLQQTPGSAFCSVELCADYSDGWVTHQTCAEQTVVFSTTVTVTQVDCYYNLNIVGTSSDGTISGYSWEIYYDTASGTGSWDLVWSSPQGMDQNDKKSCFTDVGYYRLKGYVHGSGATTSDYEDLYIGVVCTEEGIISSLPMWNGTGVDDVGGDWSRSGFGTESSAAKYAGTNGLDATSMVVDSTVTFDTLAPIDLSDYGILMLRVKVNSWASESGRLKISFDDFANWVDLADYVNIYDNEWQQAFISLEDLGVDSDIVTSLNLRSTGNMSLYFDDITLGIGTLIYRYLPTCEPQFTSHEEGALYVKGDPFDLTMSADVDEQEPHINANVEELTPRMGGSDLKPSMKTY